MVRPIGLFYYFKARRIRIYPFGGNGVKWSSCNRVFLAIVLEGVGEIDGGAVCILLRPCHLYSTVRRCLPHFCSALDRVVAFDLGFGDIALPGSQGAISPEHPDGCDRHANDQVCYDSSHCFFPS